MSDKLDEIEKLYRKDVLSDDVPRKFALFSIPEYPELDSGEGMWAVCLDALLTALRYLAPATLITLFWGQQSFLFRILRHIDLTFRAIVFSSEEQKQSVLKWLADAGQVRVEHLDTVWRHGWVLCGVLDAALPGVCAGHSPTRQTLKHAQTIADHYLGVDPVFSHQELESECLSKHQEWKLTHYLDRIRLALAKVPPPVSKPASQRTSPEAIQFTLDYVARGSGLVAAQISHMMYFKIYPTAQQSLEPGEITVLIRGPKDTYGMVVIPPIPGKSQMIRQKLLNLQATRHFTENVLPITQGATYLRTYGRTDMNKTYHIPKTKYDIEMNVESQVDYAKVGYLVNLEGKYEISVVSRGQNIVGSPFTMTASNNIIGALEKQSFFLENGEEIDIIDAKTERKVILRIVDFVTEKMLLNENGTLEKISSDDANILMTTDEVEETMKSKAMNSSSSSPDYDNFDLDTKQVPSVKVGKLKQVAKQVKSLIIACKAFYETIQVEKSKELKVNDETFVRPQSRQGIPDVVNSTFNDSMMYPYSKREVSEILKPGYSSSTAIKCDKIYEKSTKGSLKQKEYSEPDSAKKIDTIIGLGFEYKARTKVNNPFLDVNEEDILFNNKIHPDEIEEDPTLIAEIERLNDFPIKIMIQEDNDDSISPTKNPFIEPELLERPKTPVLKIITGEVKDRADGVYIDPHIERIAEDILGNEFVNPFFMHQHQASSDYEKLEPVTAFIIGAPVTLPPIVTGTSSDPDMSSIMITSNDQNFISKELKENMSKMQSSKTAESPSSVYSTPLHAKLGQNSITSSIFYSLDSNLHAEAEDNLINRNESNSKFEIGLLQSEIITEPSNKDIWDSAYVSIDENNSSPDSNNNENTLINETPFKSKFSSHEDITLKEEDFIIMGPAEKELWNSCADLACTAQKTEEFKAPKWERRLIFTPIIEESERSIPGNINESGRVSKQSEIDPVTMAFAELNDIFQEYNSTSEQSSLTTSGDYILDHSNDLEYTLETDEIRVKSASERISDVMRPMTIQKEGEISEIQPFVTESFSASQTLPLPFGLIEQNNNDETKFGEDRQTNIVIEKKKYWDDRIREIEENRSEQAKKKRLLSKNLRHNDSLSKRRGKQIVKRLLAASETNTISVSKTPEERVKFGPTLKITTPEPSDVKLVEKWKKYWDDKLETENDIEQVSCFGATLKRDKREKSLSPESNTSSGVNITVTSLNIKPPLQSTPFTRTYKDELNLSEEVKGDFKIEPSSFSQYSQTIIAEKSDLEGTTGYLEEQSSTRDEFPTDEKSASSSTLPAKQELPEELFKAFETSPKRFFGTSRKQILNKIDAYLGKPSTTDEKITSSENISGVCHEKGLVSSRVSLFHNISHVEDLPWKYGRSTSLLNIRCHKDSVNDSLPLKSQKTSSDILTENYAKDNASNKIKSRKDSNIILNTKTQWESGISSSMLNIAKCKDSEENIEPHNLKILEQSNKMLEQPIACSSSKKDHRNKWTPIMSNSRNKMLPCKDVKQEHYLSKSPNNASKETMPQNIELHTVGTEYISGRNKRIRLTDFENHLHSADKPKVYPILAQETTVKTTVKYINRQNSLRKSTNSKSEMDIFSKITSVDMNDDLDKHKSYEVLPNANVKNFINMYETVSKTAKSESKVKPLMRKLPRANSVESENLAQIVGSITGMGDSKQNVEDNSKISLQPKEEHTILTDINPDIPKALPRKQCSPKVSEENVNDITASLDKTGKCQEFQNNCTRKERYISLSDIEVQIIESGSKAINYSTRDIITKTKRDSIEKNYETDPVDYKSRFKLAKQYFQSLEELRSEDKNNLKLNECEQLLLKDSLENDNRPTKRLKSNKKSRSMDSSELAKIWNQMQGASDDSENKLVKISDKFHVDDLFTDVTEGKLSRQGSLRGIPHKKAVLEAFRSMENILDTKLSSYEMAVSHLTDFAKQNKIKNAQTYLTEYPYLPTTEPSKYHSRLDTKASGLVSMKELTNNRPRRNSVPDMFIADL